MIALWKYRILNQISWHTTCYICGARNRRYRLCGGDTGCQDLIHTRARLIAIPYSAAKYGVRVDYSRYQKKFMFYWWSPKGVKSKMVRR